MFTHRYIANYDALGIPEDITQTITRSFQNNQQKDNIPSGNNINQLNSYKIIGNSTSIRTVNESISKLAKMDRVSVLITGEPGTGKELIARGIHNGSKRKNKPFVPINCAEINPDLIRGELFGYVKGIFTGAGEDTDGCFLKAGEGTLVLDEIGDLPLEAQGILLRVLQERQIRRIGDAKETPVKCRFIFITNKNLRELVNSGHFKEDLYYRITQGEILFSPPLRERQEDKLYIAVYLLIKISVELGFTNESSVYISNSFIRVINKYEFPGNIRELEGIITRILIRNQTGPVTDTDFYGSLNLERTDHSPPSKLSKDDPAIKIWQKKLRDISGILSKNKIFIAESLACLTKKEFSQNEFISQMKRRTRLHDNTLRRYLSILKKHKFLTHNNEKTNKVRYRIADQEVPGLMKNGGHLL
ncbi:hypothetical protein DGMP_23840 [Desulfomarina profundi]|uniref:Sigma-54 factor interaction domain-containing protein n=1 Tax=Desulfomarina profundi TaxID=2772557 RepID=A0A8D5FUP0_9BACT|nr:sigma 54-interacting transcriptional regulator [Desulfomarina profundi]BCL61691.1 hypothetical protein DGMP_23840 [Desulfomarina profundi]